MTMTEKTCFIVGLISLGAALGFLGTVIWIILNLGVLTI